jgi:hypothetical protein
MSRARSILAAALVAAALGLASCASAPQPAAAGTDGAVTAAPLPADTVITWTDEAWAAFQSEVPKAVQKIAKKATEKEARDRGIPVIDMDFYNEIKKEQGR